MKITYKNKRTHDFKDATWIDRKGNALHMMKTVVHANGDRKAICVGVVNSSEVANIEGETPETPAASTPEAQVPEPTLQ